MTPRPTAQELYEQLMGKIEPELLHENIHTLDEKYKNETPEEKAARTERYNKAFQAFDEAAAQYWLDVKQQISKSKKNAFKSVEADDRVDEQGQLSLLESQLFS